MNKREYDLLIVGAGIYRATTAYSHLGSDFDLVYTDNWNIKTQLNNYQDHTTR